MTTHTNAASLDNWSAKSWDDIVGNEELKEHLKNMIYLVRKEGHRSGFNTLITGGSREGKTSTVQFGMKCLACLDLDYGTLNPCGKCFHCQTNIELYGNDAWETSVDFLDPDEAPTPIRVHFFNEFCPQLDKADIEQLIGKIRHRDDIIRVVFLDEVHRLAPGSRDELLLRSLDNVPAIWIAASAVIRKKDATGSVHLDKMFQNRFSFRLTTQRPSNEEMVTWLAHRCKEFGITCDNPKTTLMRVAVLSEGLPGKALQVLNKAHKRRDKRLTLTIVEDHVHDFDKGA